MTQKQPMSTIACLCSAMVFMICGYQEDCKASSSKWGDYIEMSSDDEAKIAKRKTRLQQESEEQIQKIFEDSQKPEKMQDPNFYNKARLTVFLIMSNYPYLVPKIICTVDEIARMMKDDDARCLFVQFWTTLITEETGKEFIVSNNSQNPSVDDHKKGKKSGPSKTINKNYSKPSYNTNNFEDLSGWEAIVYAEEKDITAMFGNAEIQRSNNVHIYPAVVVLENGKKIGFPNSRRGKFQPKRLAEKAIRELKSREARIVGNGRFFINVLLSNKENVYLMK